MVLQIPFPFVLIYRFPFQSFILLKEGGEINQCDLSTISNEFDLIKHIQFKHLSYTIEDQENLYRSSSWEMIKVFFNVLNNLLTCITKKKTIL
jgi:hypothetical protein